MKEYKYKAFISYRHLEPDKSAATRLQKLLETFSPPKGAAQTPGGSTGKAGRWRIFRDESELPASSDLGGDIREALENSEYLITICSPAFKESFQKSGWCMQEVAYFKELHNQTNDNIITLLVSGSPEESFPEELCRTRVSCTDETGAGYFREIEVEPLAANVVSASKSEMYRRLRQEYLRIAAPLAGCSYDDLYGRQRRRAVRRIVSLAAAVTAMALAFGFYNGHMRTLVEDQLLLQKIENARYLTSESRRLWNEGRRLEAIQSAYNSLPEPDEKRDPLAETEYLLSEELGAFQSENFMPLMLLHHNSSVLNTAWLCDGTRLLTKDKEGIYLWDAETGTQIGEYPASSFTNGNWVFLEDHSVLQRSALRKTDSKGNFSGYLTPFGTIVQGYRKDRQPELYEADSRYFFLNTSSGFFRVDALTGEFEQFPSKNEGDLFDTIHYFVCDGTIWKIQEPKYDENEVKIERLSSDGKTVERTLFLTDCAEERFYIGEFTSNLLGITENYVLAYAKNFSQEIVRYPIRNHTFSRSDAEVLLEESWAKSISENKLLGRYFVVVASSSGASWENLVTVALYDVETGERLWTFEDSIYMPSACSIIARLDAEEAQNDQDILAVSAGNKLFLLDFSTGEQIHTYESEDAFLSFYYTRSGFLFFITSDGRELTVLPRKMRDAEAEPSFFFYETAVFPVAINGCSYWNHRYAVPAKDSNDVYIFSSRENEDYHRFFRFDPDGSGDIQSMRMNQNKTHLLISAYKQVYLYEIETGDCRKILSLDEDEHLNAFEFYGGDTVLLWYSDTAVLYTISSGESVSTTIPVDYLRTGLLHGTDVEILPETGRFVYKHYDEKDAEKQHQIITIFDEHLNVQKQFVPGDKDFLSTRLPKLSPDGTKLVYAYSEFTDDNETVFHISLYDCESWTSREMNISCANDRLTEPVWGGNPELVWSSDSKYSMVVLNEQTLYLLDAETAERTWEKEFDCALIGCDVCRDIVYAFCQDGTLYAFDLKKNAEQSVKLFDNLVEERYPYFIQMKVEPFDELRMLLVTLSPRESPLACFLRADSLEPRFQVEECYGFIPERGEIYVAENVGAGTYPYYSEAQIRQKCEQELTRIHADAERSAETRPS